MKRATLTFFALTIAVGAPLLAVRHAAATSADSADSADSAAAVAAKAQPKRPRSADDVLLLRTTLGEIVVGLYADVAPKHVEQLERLANAGVFDGVYFYRVEPGFVLQVTSARDRRTPISSGQVNLIHPIEAEFSALKHRRGILSMAHDDGKPDSAETSFSILLGDAPHLDHEYTIFGEVLRGEEVMDAIAKTPRDNQNRPRERIWLDQVRVLHSTDAGTGVLGKPHSDAADARSPAGTVRTTPGISPELGTILVMMVLGLGVFLREGRSNPKVVASLGLLVVLAGFFAVFARLSKASSSSPWISVPLFFGTLGILKLMGRFEGPVPPPSPAAGPPRKRQ